MSAPATAAGTDHQQFALANPPSDGVSQVVWANASSGPASELLLASSWDRSLRLYDASHNLCRLQVDLPGAVLDCAFDTADTTAFAVGIDRAVTAVDLATANTRVLGYHNNTSRCLVWHAATGMLFSGGWDGKLLCWDPRAPSRPAGSSTAAGVGAVGAATPVEGEKILTMGLSGHRLIVGTSKRHVLIYDIRTGFSSANVQPEQRRESSLLNQTRCIRGFPDTTGYALSSIEGRVAIEYFNPDPNVQKNKYAFKCHRKTENGKQVLYPVNCLAFHPRYGTFATGGCDGLVNVWDGANKKRISAYPAYATSVAALAFSARGDKLAVAASYTFEEGEKDHPNDAIYVRTVQPQEVLPKQQRQAAAASSSAASVSGAR